ncbi:DUF6171 family protein [Sporolactobacillus shoreicorticis]|uniref:DUF6171 family protein n=1 Tax=Sporolactobacillus shoreicorticis TaxID=1923877 RepID=A0ABW5S0U1_9BACL|nr:DUF6171 family protein [Sporolactobacillus shoreicorticis]MCO7124708.1 DUF6171 family protein [Sporolactobacillus shoreicorticis]
MGCANCTLKQQVQDLDVNRLVAEQLSVEFDLVDEQTKAERMAICKNCPHLNLHTCALCGCFVKFRTNLKAKECPDHRW